MPGSLSSRTRLSLLFLTVLLDLVGFGIVLPLLPFYAARFGASGTEVGLLVTAYSLAQLVTAPMWGKLSDRKGRRPILLVGLAGSTISYLVFAWADSLLVLFVSRVMAGVGGATVSVAQAYIADVTPPEKRAGNLGLIGAAFGIGFVVGPALGGTLAVISPQAPGLGAAVLCGTNGLMAFFLLPESLPAEQRRLLTPGPGGGRWQAARFAMAHPETVRLYLLFLLFNMAFAAMQPTFPLFGARRFGLTERDVGHLFALLGTVSGTVQGLLVRRLVPRVGEVRLIRWASLPFCSGLLLMGYSPNLSTLLTALALLAVGFGSTLPAMTSLLSRAAPSAIQGSALGLAQSVGSLARIAGPLLAGIVYDVGGMAWPYWMGALLAAMAALVAFGLSEERPSSCT